AAGQALEPGNRKRRRGRAGRLLGAGDQAGSTPCAPPPPDASPQRLVRKWVLRGVWRGPRGCPQDQRPRGLQGTWACFGPDCAPASLRTWSSFCRAAGSRQVTVGARLCGPHGWAQRGGWPRPWPTGWGPSPASDAHSLLAELGRVGLGKPRSRRARTPHCGLGAAPAPSAPLVRVGEEKSRAGVWGVPCRASTPRVLFSVVDLVSADLEEVAQKCGLSYKALVALRRVLLAQFSAFPCNGADLYEELKTSTAILSTGIRSLDKLLDAGLYTGEVTEIVGGPGSGKTQVCLCVAANVAHSLQQKVLYIDSNGGLTASRILQLLQARTSDEEEQAGALQRIQVVRVFDIFQMLDVLQDLRGAVAQQVSSSAGTVKVVVVDSVTAVVSPLLGGQQREGLALMMQLARELKTLARDLGVAVVVTNHVTRDRDSGKHKPALGRSWSFVPSTRLLLDISQDAGAGSRRVARLTKSPRLPTGFQEMVDIGTWGTPEQNPSQGDDI
uniref:DNA repair protein RAD51 homolog 4 n=1 Tax=Sus scrofa TaxID=9823 RepID=A0A8D1T2X0_PIG